ncbi:hypothetical protein EU527_15290 [Candidatus Thorarchaeota archaeon]|nr:MAG: hypothetical protein EU527_15290 [Candidatus Thorarchaeota archaeon]
MKRFRYGIHGAILLALIILTPLCLNIEVVSTNSNEIDWPSARFGHKVQFIPLSNQMLLFGGETIIDGEYQQLDDTLVYSFSNNSWNEISSSIHPSGRHNYGLSFNSDENQVLLFGGFDNVQVLNDTWIFNYTVYQWEQVNTTLCPAPRSDTALCYDSLNQKTILFGGYDFDNGSSLQDTWIFHWNNHTWSEVLPISNPEPRYGHKMVYDSEHQNAILFGGRSALVENNLWTYSYEANTWIEVSQGDGPEEVYWHSMTYDSLNSMIVVFGGRQSHYLTTDLYNQTWIFDQSENSWTQMHPVVSPTQRVLASMTFDSIENRVLLFGGICDIPTVEDRLSDEFWAYDHQSNEWTIINQDMASNPPIRIEHILLISGVLALVVIIIWYRRSVTSNFRNGSPVVNI